MTITPFEAQLTEIGLEAVAQAQAEARALPMVEIAIGDGQHDPDGTETGLVNERARSPITRSENMGGGVWRCSASFDGTANFTVWEAAFIVDNLGVKLPLYILGSTTRAFTVIGDGSKTTIEISIALGLLPDGAVTINVLDADAITMDVLDDLSGEHNVGELFNFGLVRNVEQWMQLTSEEVERLANVWRSTGQSGILQGRQYAYGGDAAYHRPSVVNFSAFGAHDHPNYPLMSGMPELEAVINGYQIKSRHVDYRWFQPVEGGYLQVAGATPPAVPPSVLAQPTPQAQTDEMREYLIAFQDRDQMRRDYRDYFDTYLSYLEIWFETLTGDVITDTMQSFRHQYESASLKKLVQNYIVQASSGLKSRFENTSLIPTMIRSVDDRGRPQFALLRYRVGVVRLGSYRDYPVDQMVGLIDDPVTRQARGLTDSALAASRSARFRVLNAMGDDSIAARSNPGLLDEIFGQVPGLNGGGTMDATYTDTNVNGSTFVQREMAFKTTNLLNAANYSRFYSFQAAGAAGRRDYRRGFSDPMLFVAKTTQAEVAPLPGMGGGHRVSQAIPLELMVASPLHAWNPYTVPVTTGAVTGTGVTAGAAYSAAKDDAIWFMTPADLFAPQGNTADPADTATHKWMMCGDGQARLMAGSGIYVTLPTLPGGQSVRMRWPVAPVHHEGSFAHGELTARQRETRSVLARQTGAIAELNHRLINGGLI